MDVNTIKARQNRFAVLIFALGILCVSAMSGCATGVSRDYLFSRLREGTAPLIVDVRTQGEYDRDHVPGAVRIPFYALGTRLVELTIPTNEPVVLYCEHGPRASLGAFFLRLAGYENVYSLEGQMPGWRKSSFPLEMLAPEPGTVRQESLAPNDPSKTADGRLELVAEPIFRGQAHIYEAGREHALSVVLIHGIGNSGMKDWKNVIPALAVQYHVVAFDLPGFGRSSRQNALYSPERYADFVAWVVRQYVKGPFAVIGHSLGGAVALQYAATEPEGLQRLIIADAAGILQRVALAKILLQIEEGNGKRRALEKTADKLNDFTRVLLDSMDRDGVTKSFEALLADPALRLTVLGGNPAKIASLALILDDFSAVLDHVRVPTLVIWGEHDTVAPLRTGRILEARLHSARLELIRNAGHSPMLDQPERFISIVLNELKMNVSEPPKPMIADVGTGRIGICDGQNRMRFSGDYRLITLKDCKGVEITNATVGKIEATGSEALIENTKIAGSDRGLKAFRSELTLTNVFVSGDIPIEASRSRLDLAGVRLKGEKAAVVVEKESILVFSVSVVESLRKKGYVHGCFKLAKTAY